MIYLEYGLENIKTFRNTYLDFDMITLKSILKNDLSEKIHSKAKKM